MIDRVLDALLPTRKQPLPAMGTQGGGRVLLDRVLAVVIDLLLCYFLIEVPVIYVLSTAFPGEYQTLGATAPLLSLAVLVPLYLTYAFLLEWQYGRTPGKVNRGLLVVMSDGSPLTIRASAIRNLARYVDFLGIPPFVIGLFAARLGDGQRIGDRLADTVVVRSRAPDEVDAVAHSELETSAAARSDTGADPAEDATE